MSLIGESLDLRCPLTRLPLRRLPLHDAEDVAGAPLAARSWGTPRPFGRSHDVLLRSDGACAYPIVDEVPILLAPEMLCPNGDIPEYSLRSSVYAEAYEEMPFYNAQSKAVRAEIESDPHTLAPSSVNLRTLDRLARLPEAEQRAFPFPATRWLHAGFDAPAEWDVYQFLAPLDGRRILQVGGDGRSAIMFLLAGGSEATVLSPMVGELQVSAALAVRFGIANRLSHVAAVAEEMPFPDGTFDIVYAGSSLHHLVVDRAAPELARVLVRGGKFAAIEPWRGPFYAIGIRVLGKREPIHCRPLTAVRVQPLFESFARIAVTHHGALTRYPLIALHRLGVAVPLRLAWWLNRFDDHVASLLPPIRRTGSSVSICATA